MNCENVGVLVLILGGACTVLSLFVRFHGACDDLRAIRKAIAPEDEKK